MLQEQILEKMSARQKKKVLVVDDSVSIRELMKIMLEGFGFENIYLAWDGLSSLEIFQKEKPDITFLDMNLPSMSGLETIKIMLSVNPYSKIVLTTAFPKTDRNVREAISFGATYYLEKPLDKKKIEEMIERIEREEKKPEEKNSIKSYLSRIEKAQAKIDDRASYLVFEFDSSEQFNDFSLALSDTKYASVKGLQFYKGKFVVTVEILPGNVDMLL